jgi:hypothetical protein
MIPYSRVEKALQFLAETDEEAAELKADVERAAHFVKRAKSLVVLHTSGTGPIKQATAETDPTVEKASEEYFVAIKNNSAMINKRKLQELVIDVWRSINSARNKGQII